MKLQISINNNKGYTLIELMITLMIFAIIAMFGVPAFYGFIEQSRAKTQMIQAANFLRSAQEISTATNRVVYVYTDDYLNYNAANLANYWYSDWVMSFKPIGHTTGGTNNTINTISDQDTELGVGSNDPTQGINYLITRQRIFTPSNAYKLFIVDSSNHNSVDFASMSKETLSKEDTIEMDGYSIVRNSAIQGAEAGKPTFLTFHPSGAVTMPIFIIAEDGSNQTFINTDIKDGKANNWAQMKEKVFINPLGILAGCRLARGLNIDSINYTFNKSIIGSNTLFDTPIHNDYGYKYFAAPSFTDSLCGSTFLQ